MVEIGIRQVRAADIPVIARIYAAAVEHGTATLEIEPPDEAEMAWRQEALVGAGYLVAESAGLVAGYAYAGAYRHAALRRLQARPRARHRADAAPARRRRYQAARNLRRSEGEFAPCEHDRRRACRRYCEVPS
jgi:hypothetical protein